MELFFLFLNNELSPLEKDYGIVDKLKNTNCESRGNEHDTPKKHRL